MKKHLAVIYLKNGNIDISRPFDTREEAIAKLKSTLEKEGNFERVKATTVIVRDMENFKDGMLFGNPKSLDLVQDKKFIKSITK